MTPATRRVARPGWRRWAALSRVGLVTLYTRGSLLLVLAATNALVLAAAAVQLDGGGARLAGLLAGGAAVTLAGLWALSVLIDHVLGTRRLPVPAIAAVLVSAAAIIVFAFTGLDGATRSGAITAAVVALSLALGVLPKNRIAYALLLGAGVVAALRHPTAGAIASGMFVAAAFVATSRLSMWILGIVRDLDDARRAQSELAVMEERLRFSRDVHDVLGRRLSTIAVKSELAATLAQRGDDRAPDQMLEVREVAHQALREARELARGYRATHFGQELEGARSLLRSAGIEVQLRVDDLPHAWQEPAAWVVRESVTNVLRHSRATVVDIAWSAGRLEIVNDGLLDDPGAAGDPAESAGTGVGLRGLRERLEPLGAMLDAGAQPSGRWSVAATFPGTGPLSARTNRDPFE